MKNENMCNRCILNDEFPNIKFDRNGICNNCHNWDKEWMDFDYNKAEQQLQLIFKDAKSKKRKYDCMVPYSGGRDSSYVLYLCKEKYGMNPLAVTFNNLFMSDYAFKNILSTVPKLGVDHVMVSFQPDLLKSFYRAMILKGGEFCSICTCGINYVITVYQQLFNIPLVISGVSSRVDEQSPFEVTSTHPSYVRKVLLESGFSYADIDSLLVKRQSEASAKEKIKLKLTDSDFLRINMPDYLSWNNQEIQDTLEKKLHWQTPDKNMDHIDCRFASIKTFLKNKQIPHFIFKQEKYSQLIRDGQMTREEAINSLNVAIKHEHEQPAELNEFLKYFDITLEDIDNKEGRCHLDYIKKEDTFVKESMGYKLLAIPWKVLRVLKYKCRH